MNRFLRYFGLLLLTLAFLCFLAVTRGRIAFPGWMGPRFDADISMAQRDAILARRPQVVLLGDSMVEENVDTPALSAELGREVYTVSYPGAASAMWYLSVKNNIVNSPYKPPVLVILFRDTILTTPAYRADGKFTAAIDTLAGQDEPFLLELAYLGRMNPLEKFARKYFPLYEYGFRIRDRVDFLVQYPLPRLLLHCGNRCVDAANLEIFNFRTGLAPAADDPVAQAESVLYTGRALDFYGQVERSFLPEIIRLCRENGIRLILVRGKTISFADIPKPAGLDEYIRDLGDYLARNGVSFVDLEADSRLTSADFIDRFHVQPGARGTYTHMLAEGLGPLLP